MPHSILSANQENKLFILELHDIQSVGKPALSPHILISTNLGFEKMFSKGNTLLGNQVFMSNKKTHFYFFFWWNESSQVLCFSRLWLSLMWKLLISGLNSHGN